MEIETLAVGEIQANCCIVWGPERQAIVMDPGAEPHTIRSFLEERDLTVAAYMLTHGHVDHICALADLRDALPAPVGLHPADQAWAFSSGNQFPPFYPVPRKPASIERDLADGQTWQDGGLVYRVIATPGHSPGSVCFHFPDEQVLFTGDTLFAGSVGRTDLPGGDSRTLQRSLGVIAALPDATTVYSGHGPVTDIAQEKAHNFFLQGFA